VLAFGAYRGSTTTDPMKFAGAPVAERREPFDEMTALSAKASPAPRITSEMAAAAIFFMSFPSVIVELSDFVSGKLWMLLSLLN
jgi:hypothetical protein